MTQSMLRPQPSLWHTMSRLTPLRSFPRTSRYWLVKWRRGTHTLSKASSLTIQQIRGLKWVLKSIFKTRASSPQCLHCLKRSSETVTNTIRWTSQSISLSWRMKRTTLMNSWELTSPTYLISASRPLCSVVFTMVQTVRWMMVIQSLPSIRKQAPWRFKLWTKSYSRQASTRSL